MSFKREKKYCSLSSVILGSGISNVHCVAKSNETLTQTNKKFPIANPG